MGNILKYALLSFIIILVGAKYYHLTKKETTGIDVMAAHLAPAKKLLHLNSSIGFYSNGLTDSAQILYTYVAFVLHPIVIRPGKADTMLLVVDKRYPAIGFPGYKTIVQNEDGRFIYSLIKTGK